MKTLRYFFLSALVAVAGLFTACVEDTEIAPGEFAEGPQVHFLSDATTDFTLTTEDEAVEIPVVRVETVGSIEVPVMAVIAEEDVELFTVPASVVFADGVAESSLEIAFDRASMEDGKSYQVAITLDDPTMTTPYGNSSVVLNFTIPEPYVLMGKALVWDGIVYTLFTSSVPEDPIEVEVYEHLNYPGYIFLKNLYTKMYPFEYFLDFGMTEKEASTLVSYPEEDVYFVIDITNPNAVDVPVQKIGLNVSYGEMTVGMLSDAGGAAEADCFGTLKNGVITFPPKKMIIADNDGTYYANSAGGFKVALPGAVLTDFSVEAQAAGHVANQAGQASPVVNVTAGADVAGVAVGFVAGDVTADYASVVETVAAEKPNYTTVVEGACTVAGSEPMEAGQVTAVVVPFDANGVAQVEDAIAIAFYFAGCGAGELPPVVFEVALYPWTAAYDPTEENDDTNSIVFQVGGQELKAAAVSLFSTAAYEGYIAEGYPLEAFVDPVEDALPQTWIDAMNEGKYPYSYYYGLPAATSFTMIGYAENTYGNEVYLASEPLSTAEVAAAVASAKAKFNGQGMLKSMERMPLTIKWSQKVVK